MTDVVPLPPPDDESSVGTKRLRRSMRIAAATGALDDYEVAAKDGCKVLRDAATTTAARLSEQAVKSQEKHAELLASAEKGMHNFATATTGMIEVYNTGAEGFKEKCKEISESLNEISYKLRRADTNAKSINDGLRNAGGFAVVAGILAAIGLLLLLVFTLKAAPDAGVTGLRYLLFGIMFVSAALTALTTIVCMFA